MSRPLATNMICGVPLTAFREAPSPAELARIVAQSNSEWQAVFFSRLAEELRNCCGGNYHVQVAMIAKDISALEEELGDGGASNFLSTLASDLKTEVE